MKHGTLPVLVLLLGALPTAAAAGCSSSSSSSDPVADGGNADGGVDATPEGPKTKMTAWAFEQTAPGATPKPIAGAIVAVDPAGGGNRIEKTVEADGHVDFDVDIAQGGPTITVFHPDYVAFTSFNLTPDNIRKLPKNNLGKPEDNLVFLMEKTQGAFEKSSGYLGGVLAGKPNAGDTVVLSHNLRGTAFDNAAQNFGFFVEIGKPFTILGWELGVTRPDARSIDTTFVKHFQVDQPALTATGGPKAPSKIVTIDVGATPALADPTPRKWKVELPGGDSGPLGGSSACYCTVFSLNTQLLPGVVKRSAPSADKAGFDCESWISPTTPPADAITRAVVPTADGSVAVHLEKGVLADGAVMKNLLVPPAITIEKVKLADAIPIDAVAPDKDIQLRIMNGPDLIWVIGASVIIGRPGSIKIPAPPTGMKLPATVDANFVVLSGQLRFDGDPNIYVTDLAGSRTFSISK